MAVPYQMEAPLFKLALTLLASGLLLVLVGGLPLRSLWRGRAARITQYLGASLFVEGILVLVFLSDPPRLIQLVAALLAVIGVPWAATRRVKQLWSTAPMAAPAKRGL